MEFLLDTHAILWFQSSNNKLSQIGKQLIEDANNQCYVSFASLWEMSIKVALGKLQIEMGFNNFYNYLNNQFKILNPNVKHLNTLIELPYYHNDPFDRLLIAQAITENISIISADQHFKSYPINVIW
jgi:PIN domain nuclease of toxin-antitoxin system